MEIENTSEVDEKQKKKRQRKHISVDLLCKGIKPNGDQCKFSHIKDSLYCHHHKPKTISEMTDASTWTDTNEMITSTVDMVDSSTNTEETMLDLTTANQVILDLIDDKVEKQRAMTELIELYLNLRDDLEQLQTVN